ncbi:MAG: response regulator [Chloroflexi bacterium]|nr:response regulator [Chloroflexota bacterium]
MERNFSLLIVDDDVTLASNLQDILEDEGYNVAVANDGKTAIGLCAKDNFDLALIDLRLPDRAGVSLVKELTDLCGETEYIIITGYASVDTAVEAVAEKQIIAYETKPLDMERFLNLVRQVRERKWAQKTLRKKESQLGFILERTPCILWTMDREFRYTSSMGAGLAALKQLPDEIVGKTLFEVTVSHDPDSPVILAHRRAMAGTPATYEMEREGRALLCHVEPLLDERGEIAGLIGLAMDITERKRAEDELRAMSRRLVELQEKERRAIARELHDQTGQLLTALKIQLDRIAHSPPEKVSSFSEDAQALVNELMSQIRNMSLDLRPSMLDDLGLLPALLWHFERYTAQTHVRVDFKHSGLRERLPADVSTAAYRIVQEALTNVVRHSGVNEVSVQAWADHNALFVRIEDKGCGFDIETMPASSSGGVSGIRERARLLDGKVEITSAQGAGTCILAELPYSRDDDKQTGGD